MPSAAIMRRSLPRCLIARRSLIQILNSPNNPTGGMLSDSDLEFIADLALRHNCWVLSDEVFYSHLVFDGEFTSIASLPDMQDRTILVDGFSKTYAMTGWRLGYGVMMPSWPRGSWRASKRTSRAARAASRSPRALPR